MAKQITRVTLFVPGAPRALASLGEWVDNDGAFGDAFSAGTVAPDVLAAIDAAPGAVVAHFDVDLRTGRSQIIAAVERLRAGGALAVRLEQSKLGWSIADWLALMSDAHAASWHRAAVVFLRADDALQSCGMHAFSLPDVLIDANGDPAALQQLASALNVYELAEDPVFVSGHTFAPDRDTPRRIVERWPDTTYPADHACHNPYGVWRLGAPGGPSRRVPKLPPVFVPTLAALLKALETEQGAPLTRAQVEAVRDRGTCIAMEPKDAAKLERERGYADLDPTLAWEQWQLIR